VRMMFQLADRPLTLAEKPDAKPLAPGRARSCFDDVSFAYQDGQPVLERFDLTIAPGQMTALVGPSGSGKSTMLNLIMRMYDPQGGKVLFDGQDIAHATLGSLRQKIAYVSQDTFLFAGTVMHNIRLGRQDATDEEVIAAAKAGNAHDFITAMTKATTRRWARTARCFPAASASGFRSRVPCCAMRRSCFWTRRPARSTPNRKRCFATRCSS